jgi:predicted AAA+ superfamily ATPase
VVSSQDLLLPLEVKYQAGKKDMIPSGIQSFMQKYDSKKALVITKDYLGKRINNDLWIFFVPAYLLG